MRATIAALAIVCGLLSTSRSASADVNRLQFGGASGQSWDDLARVNAVMDVETVPGSIQPFELHPEENILRRLGPWARYRNPRDPLWRPGNPRIWRFHFDNANALDWDPLLLLDADPATGMAATNYETLFLAWEYYTLDFGADLPLERFVFIPKEGSDVLSGEPYNPGFAQRNFETSAGFEEELSAAVKANTYNPLSVWLAQVFNNFNFRVEIRFPLQNFRLLRHRAYHDEGRFDNDSGSPAHYRVWPALPYFQPKYGLGELELYGRGFVPKATWESVVVDLGEMSNVGQVQFGLSRWRKEGDEYVEAAEGDYINKLKTKQWPWHPDGVGWRGPIVEDTNGWSYWSAPIRSSDVRPRLPRGRYLKIKVQLETESLWEFARMESLVVVTSPVLAERVLGELAVAGELHPEGNVAQVTAGEETELIYDIRAEFVGAAQSGFDAVRVLPPSKARFLALEMGDPPVPAEPDSVVPDGPGFVVYLPRPIVAAGDDRLRLRLETTLYDAAAEVAAEAFARGGDSLPQTVDPGDANAEVGTDQLRLLVASASFDEVLGPVDVRPQAFTPQGDGVNDQIALSYILFSARLAQVEVGVYNLNGRRVRQIFSGLQNAGAQSWTWDGRSDKGGIVAPGLYLVRVEVDADAERFARMQPIAVAY